MAVLSPDTICMANGNNSNPTVLGCFPALIIPYIFPFFDPVNLTNWCAQFCNGSEFQGTVGNFVGLAEGNIKNDVQAEGTPYFDGLKFHRVIEDFMVQGGCPQGSGVGGPGYQFNDEFHPDLKHDKPGILSMAHAGPGSNGSQFFIMHVDYPLPYQYTIFGKVTDGLDVIDTIASVQTAEGDKPVEDVVILGVTVSSS